MAGMCGSWLPTSVLLGLAVFIGIYGGRGGWSGAFQAG